jgi:hypothetical protein
MLKHWSCTAHTVQTRVYSSDTNKCKEVYQIIDNWIKYQEISDF